MAERELEELVEELGKLLDEEYGCLLAWQPQQLLEIAEKRRQWEAGWRKATHALGAPDRALRERVEQLRQLGFRNLGLARAALKTIEGIYQLLGCNASAVYRPTRNLETGPLEPVLERVV